MEQIDLGKISESTKLASLSKDELVQQNVLLKTELATAIREISKLKNQNLTDEQLNFILQEQLAELQNTIYGTSSERYKKPEDQKKEKPEPLPRVKLPSERYPNIPVREIGRAHV